MEWWLYKGNVTTPVDVPGQGPTIIRPRMKFQAPLRSVAHLKSIGLVVLCRDPNSTKGVMSPAPVVVAPKRVEARSELPSAEPQNGGTDGASSVVALSPSAQEPESESSKDEPNEDAWGEEVEEEAENEGQQESSEQKEEAKGTRKSKRSRG